MQIADLVLASAIMFGSVLSVQAKNNWMEDLEDSRLVTSLSLPGAHDAATGEGWMGIAEITGDLAAKAQDLTVAEQWNAGVRVFDIRPQVDESKSYNGETVYDVKGLKLLNAVIAQNFRQSTGIIEARKASERADDSWFTLDGRRVSGQPKARGIYLHRGRKILK